MFDDVRRMYEGPERIVLYVSLRTFFVYVNVLYVESCRKKISKIMSEVSQCRRKTEIIKLMLKQKSTYRAY